MPPAQGRGKAATSPAAQTPGKEEAREGEVGTRPWGSRCRSATFLGGNAGSREFEMAGSLCF